MQTLTETTEINISLHPDILGVMWPADARIEDEPAYASAFYNTFQQEGPGNQVNIYPITFFMISYH